MKPSTIIALMILMFCCVSSGPAGPPIPRPVHVCKSFLFSCMYNEHKCECCPHVDFSNPSFCAPSSSKQTPHHLHYHHHHLHCHHLHSNHHYNQRYHNYYHCNCMDGTIITCRCVNKVAVIHFSMALTVFITPQ